MKHIYSLFLFFTGLFFFNACIDDPDGPDGILKAGYPVINIVETLGDQTATTQEVSAKIESRGGAPITKYGFYVEPVDSEGETKTYVAGTDNKIGDFTYIITDLKNETTYRVWAFAMNGGNKESHSSKLLFTTKHGLGTVMTLPAQEVKATSAIVGGKVIQEGEGEIEMQGVYYWIQGQDAKFASITSQTDSFASKLTNLQPETEYHATAYVRNTFGEFPSDTITFTTTSGKSEIGAITITPDFTAVNIVAEIKSEGDSPVTTAGFAWTTTAGVSPNIEEHDTVHAVIENGKFSGRIDKLTSQTRYYMRAFSENEFGITYSNDTTFFTKSDQPTVSISIDEATLKDGSISVRIKLEDSGSSQVKEMKIMWGDNKVDLSNSIVFSPDENDFRDGIELTATLNKLRGGITYHVSGYAINDTGEFISDPISFSTPALFVTKASFEGVRLNAASFTYSDMPHLIGGDMGAEFSDDLLVYNTDNDKWITLAKFPEKAKGITAVVVSGSTTDEVYTVGGVKKVNNLNVGVDVTYRYNIRSNDWSELGTLPTATPSLQNAVSSMYNQLYVVGGEDQEGITSQYVYTFLLGNWVPKRDLPQPIVRGVSFVYEDEMYVGLGDEHSGRGIWKYLSENDSWSEITTTSECIGMGHVSTGVLLNKTLFTVDDKGVIWEYDLVNDIWHKRSGLEGEGYTDFHIFNLNGTLHILAQNRMGKTSFRSYDPIWDPRVE